MKLIAKFITLIVSTVVGLGIGALLSAYVVNGLFGGSFVL